MGEVSTSLLEADVEAPEDAVDETVAAAPRRAITRRMIAVAVVGVLVVAGGVVGGVTWANQLAHDTALASAASARATAAHAEAAHRATVAWLVTAVAGGIASRDAVSADVLAYQDLLGGAEALAPVAESTMALGTTLADVLEVEAPTAETVIPDAVARAVPVAIDPEASTDELTALAEDLADEAHAADVARVRLAARADDVDSAVADLGDELELLAASLPPVHQVLLANRPLASESSKSVAAAALASLATADGAELPVLFQSYAGAASGVIAAHDAEVARRAAEAARIAAEEAAKKARSTTKRSSSGSSGAGGGGGTQQRGVLDATNVERAKSNLGALSWSSSLASSSCAFAVQLAAKNGDLYHSGGVTENVAYGYQSVSQVVAGWMGSPGHRANILGPSSTMAACSATSSTGRIYWVQQFR